MAMEDDEATQALQPARKIDFFGGEELFAEAADRPERRGLAEEKRACRPATDPAERVPGLYPGADRGAGLRHGHGAAAADPSLGVHCGKEFLEKRRAWRAVRVDEKQPIARGCTSAGVASARDLVYRLEHDLRADGARDVWGEVGGVVVADDELGGPAAPLEHAHSGLEVIERSGDQALLVERRNDDRKLHCAGGATITPLTPCFSTSWATRPEAFAFSTNSRRYFALEAFFFGTPIDCCTAVKCPSSTREPGIFCASARRPGLRPASASSFWSVNSFTDAGMPSTRTSCAFFRVRVR